MIRSRESVFKRNDNDNYPHSLIPRFEEPMSWKKKKKKKKEECKMAKWVGGKTQSALSNKIPSDKTLQYKYQFS